MRRFSWVSDLDTFATAHPYPPYEDG